MNDDSHYFLLALVYFAIFLIAGIVVGNEYGSPIKVPVLCGMVTVCFYFWSRYIGRL